MTRTGSVDEGPSPPDDDGWEPPVARLFPTAHRRLVRRLDQLARGTGGFVVVRGERDSGVPWLVDDIRARHAGTVLVGRASPATSDVPLWPLHEALAGVIEAAAPTPTPTGAPVSFGDIHVTTDAAVALSLRSPTLLVVEHLEHAHRASLAALEHLAEAGRSHPLLCVVTLSSSGLAPADELVDSLLERDLAQHVDCAPLAGEAIADLVAELLGGNAPTELVDFVVDQSGGLPQLAERIVLRARRRRIVVRDGRRWRVAGPVVQAVPDEVVSRTARALLTAATEERDLVIAAAVLGRPAELRVLAASAGCDLDATLDHLQHCVELELLRWVGSSASVRSGIVRDIALGGLTARTSLDVLERLAAAASATGGAGHGFALAVDLLEQGGRVQEATRHRLRVASRACAVGQLAEADAQLAAVVLDGASAEDEALVAELAMEVAARGGGGCADAARRAARLDAVRPDRRGATAIAHARAIAAADPAAAAVLAREALVLDPAATVWAELVGAVATPLARRPSALRALVGVGRLRGGPGSVALRHLAAIELAADPAAAGALLRRAVDDAANGGDDLESQRAVAGLVQLDLLRSGSGRALATESSALCARGDRVVGPALAVEAAVAMALADDLDRAEGLLAKAIDAVGDASPSILARATTTASLLAVMRDVGEASTTAAPPVAAFGALLADDVERARHALRCAGDDGDPGPSGVATTQLRWLVALVPLLERLLGHESVAGSTDWAWTRHVAAVHRLLLAAEHGAAGRVEQAVADVTEADAALATVPVVQLLARRLIGELAVRDGWADRSIELLLRAALAAAVDRELDAVAARCRTLLRDGGFAVPRFADGGSTVPIDLRATGVTAREMEIVRHLVAGRTTVEIADELFVSVATVRSHIANATHKLGYSSRSELLEGMAALQI